MLNEDHKKLVIMVNPFSKPLSVKVEKIVLTEEQLKEVQDLLNEKPPHKTTSRFRFDTIKKKYYKGVCMFCEDWPAYKVLYKYEGCIRVEHFCEKHIGDLV